jgi:hypothetical protein
MVRALEENPHGRTDGESYVVFSTLMRSSIG